MSVPRVELSRTGRMVLSAFLAFCLLGLLLFLIQAPSYYQEAQETERRISLTRTALALTSPTAAPTPSVSPTPEQGTASPARFFENPFLLLMLLVLVVFFMRRKRR